MREVTRTFWLAVAVVWLVWGCDAGESDGGGADAAPVDGAVPGADGAGRDASEGEDAGPNDATVGADAAPNEDAAPDAWMPDFVAPPLAPESEPTRVEIESWLVGRVPQDDPVYAYLERGGFQTPPAGRDRQGITWLPAVPTEEGGFGDVGRGVAYAVTTLDIPPGERVYGRPDAVLEIFSANARQPGDGYRSGRARVPVLLDASQRVVARLFGGRGEPSLALWRTPDELVFNLADLTAPDFPAGWTGAQWLGVPVLNLTPEPALDAVARVVESEHFHGTATWHPSLPGGAATQLAFHLRPKAPFTTPEVSIPVELRVEVEGLTHTYARTIEVAVVAPDVPWRRTFRDPTDASVQYYGVRPPTATAPGEQYGLALSLHGAGVDAIGQARAYSAKDWAYVIAPTNRRPFGFDWEEWGKLNGIAALEDAMATFAIDPTRVYLTGHSMGGHGTWHLGVHHADRFAVVAPSAGWSSFYSYVGAAPPQGLFARARAHSQTNDYLGNLAGRGIYIIHGDADDNVPVREGRDMYALAQQVTEDIVYHEEPGAGHWWDGDRSAGADCVDWPPLFEFMQARTLDPTPLDFSFRTANAGYSDRYSFVRLRSSHSPLLDLTVESQDEGDTVTLSTENVRSLELDGDALLARGVETVVVDGEGVAVTPGPMHVGPAEGKRPGQHGPFNEVYRRPFCFVYPEREPAYARFAAYMVSDWQLTGNGTACALPRDAVGERHAHLNLIWLGGRVEHAPRIEGFPLSWTDREVEFAGERYPSTAAMYLVPAGQGLHAVMVATFGWESLLYRVPPFNSRSGLPDYLVWSESAARATGFFTAEWTYDARFGAP